MFKTKNGNNKITLEEFAEKLKKFSPLVDKRFCSILYEELDGWLIHDIVEIKPNWDSYNLVMRYVKAEFRDRIVPLYIHLGYDAPKDSFVPQDMPFKLAILDKKDGETLSLDWIRNKLKEKQNDRS